MTVYIETYGCRMNICDSEIILSLLAQEGYVQCQRIEDADIIILNCCSGREAGNKKAYERLADIAQKGLQERTIVICGCFATRLDYSFFEDYPFVDIIIGPDQYRSLPGMLLTHQRHIVLNEVRLDEMYSDISLLRSIEDKTTAAITVMKGCNQYCSYCIEPYTRGREHSRDIDSILRECRYIVQQGYRELTFVGHIIDRYAFGFSDLLDMTATMCPELRIKFLSSHPLTFTDDILATIKRHSNIMRVIHLPVESGSDSVLKRMHRGYSVQQYKKRYQTIKREIPDMTIVTDIMVGFCGETEDEFQQTLDLVQELAFDDINVFQFSMREGTAAFLHYCDDVPEVVKQERQQIIIETRDLIKKTAYSKDIGKTIPIIVEGRFSRDRKYQSGRDYRHRTVLFEANQDIAVNSDAIIQITEVSDHCLIGIQV